MASAATVSASQEQVYAIGAFPASDVDATQIQVVASIKPNNQIQARQFQVLALGRGTNTDPSVRAWTFTLDNHDFYVLRLGLYETLVYDDLTQQWYTWSSGDTNLWKAYHGSNWLGGERWAFTYGSNIIVGDDLSGSIYFLNPDQDTDDSSTTGAANSEPFLRQVYGQMAFRGYSRMPSYGLQIQGSIGYQTNTSLTGVDLLISDDRGQSYRDAGTITVTPGAIDTRLYWRSLGSMRAPGRIFQVNDYGALKRIDSLEMLDGSGK